MKPVTRDRLVLPILLPIGILVVIAGALYGFSRIMLSLPPTAATATALTVASGIVVVSAIAASRRQVRLSTILAMLGATAGIAMLAGGIALAVAPEEEESGGEGERPVVVLAAFNIAFEPTSLVAPADEAFTLRFNNRDAGVQHNVDIFDNADFSGTALFEGELVTGVHEAADREQHEHRQRPGREARREDAPERPQQRRDRDEGEGRDQEARGQEAHLHRQLVQRDQLHGPEPARRVEAERVGGHCEA